MRAADYGETDFVKLLLEHGADINAKNDHGQLLIMKTSNYATINYISGDFWEHSPQIKF